MRWRDLHFPLCDRHSGLHNYSKLQIKRSNLEFLADFVMSEDGKSRQEACDSLETCLVWDVWDLAGMLALRWRLYNHCSLSVCLFAILSVSVSTITAKVISWFHSNYVLWLGPPIGEQYFRRLTFGIWSRIWIPDHFSTFLTIAQ